MLMSKELVSEEELASVVESVVSQFPDDIERIRYSVGEDWSGDPCVSFRVLLKDEPGTVYTHESLEEKGFFALCDRIESAIERALGEIPLLRYFNFRFVSEQAKLQGPDW